MSKEHHIGFVVDDLDAAVREFVTEGWEIVKGPAEDQTHRVASVKRPEATVPLELIAPLDTDGPVRGRGSEHIAYESDSLEEDVEQERMRGGKIVLAPVMAVNIGCRVAFVNRRSGLIVELVDQRAGGSNPVEADAPQ